MAFFKKCGTMWLMKQTTREKPMPIARRSYAQGRALTFRVRVSAKEMDEIRARARVSGKPVTDYARAVLCG